jgi:hypothetical protein
MMRHIHPNCDTSATGHTTRRRGDKRYSIPNAAKVLGLTEEAVRQRVKRGTLDSIKVGGSLFVLLNNDTSANLSNDQEQPVGDRPFGSIHELPLETVWKIAGGLVERGFWQYKRAK